MPAAAKSPKRRRGLLRGAPFRCSKSLHPGPHYGGRPPEKLCFISGAQNLTGGSKFPPGHWALGVQNLELLQFHNGAWVFSANAPGANPGGPGWDRPLRRRETVFVIRRRGGSQTRPLKPSPSKGEGVWPEARRMRVLSWYAHPPAGGPRASPTQTRKICGKPVRLGRATARVAPTEIGKRLRIRRPPEPHLSPTATKALSIRGVPSSRPLPSERQRKTRENQSAELPAPLR